MWKQLSDWTRRVLPGSRRASDRESLRTHIEHLETTCDVVRYAPLPAVGGTAHVVEVIREQMLYKTVGRTRLEAYEKMVEQLATGADPEKQT